jgi:hypothetical protein
MIELHYHDAGSERLAEIQAAGQESIVRCTVELWTECLKACGVSNPRPYDTPSRPDEPPRLRTGFGQRNIAYEIEPGRGRVGVRKNARYMAFLDQGTRYIDPRPWLLATAKKIWGRLQALALGKRG